LGVERDDEQIGPFQRLKDRRRSLSAEHRVAERAA
jgi:hypothetical protein